MIKSQVLNKLKIPNSPGVYFFKQNKVILYIGRATSLKDRIRSYFSKDLISTRGPLLVDLLFKANKIDFIKTDSVLEAIILEANLIKKYQPKYNTKEKDNKSFNYIIITKEDWPRILIVRGREIEKGLPFIIKDQFGPYTNSEALRSALKIIRKIFPFRDRCVPLFGKPCFNKQIGLCPGVCDHSINKKEYLKNIKKIRLILSGKFKTVIKNLKKEMNAFSKIQQFEKAGEIKKQIFSLEHIQDVAIIASEATTFSPPQLRRGDYSDNQGGCFRIEAYDASHLSGTNNGGDGGNGRWGI